jgi:hypothetical protein
MQKGKGTTLIIENAIIKGKLFERTGIILPGKIHDLSILGSDDSN